MEADLFVEANKKEKKNTLENYRYIDLFAGIGGFHLALQDFGAKCVFASEWDEHAARVYENNFGLKPFGDITKIHEEEIPEHDILCAGFPCQAFSISGLQKGFEDTRGTLFFDIARIVDYHKPKILLLENVKNLALHDNGNTLDVIKSTILSMGYDIYYEVLNASDFGLPQNRERVFIVGFRRDTRKGEFAFPKPIKKRTSLIEVLEEDSKTSAIQRDDIDIYKDFCPQKDVFGEYQLPNRPIQIGRVNKGGQGERIYSVYGHACTLSAYGGGVGAKTGLYLVNGIVRKLSPRECARLQGFPDSFQLDTNKNQAYKQFGNSVAVNVLQKIIEEVVKVI